MASRLRADINCWVRARGSCRGNYTVVKRSLFFTPIFDHSQNKFLITDLTLLVLFKLKISHIPSGPSYGVYISQLIRYARCCSHYDDFRYRHKCLVDRLLSQGYKALRLEKSFKKFYGRYQDLIEKYRRSVNAMVSDSFPGQFLFNM